MAKRFGTGTAFLYGVGGTVVSCAVQSFKLGSEAKNKAEVGDELGNEIERYKDDIHDEATIELKYRAGYSGLRGRDLGNREGGTRRDEQGPPHRHAFHQEEPVHQLGQLRQLTLRRVTAFFLSPLSHGP